MHFKEWFAPVGSWTCLLNPVGLTLAKMKTPARIEFLLLLFCAMVLASRANPPETSANRNLKMETINRTFGQPSTYLYRAEPAGQ